MDDETYAKYKGTELESAVAHDGKYAEIRVMKRDPETNYCVKFDNGICAIHKNYGASMLSDACNFYPRVTRKLGEEILITASLSCPEIARLALFENSEANWQEIETERLPHSLSDYGDDELANEQALKIHEIFLKHCASTDDPGRILARIYVVAQSLSRIAKKDWPGAVEFYLKTADSRLPKTVSEVEDKYKILQIFAALIYASGKKPNQRLQEVLTATEKNLNMKFNWETLEISLLGDAPEIAADNNVLRKYLLSQLSFSTFPYAGLGINMAEKAKLLCFKFALTKLLISGLKTEAEIIQTIQSTARTIDHIASPELIFKLMDDFGWKTDARIVGLLNCAEQSLI